MAQADHFFDENDFLLAVQACKQGLGRIGDVALIHRAIVEKLGLVAHLLDNIVGRVALGARNSQVQTVGAVMAEIMHRAVEAGPMLLLLGRELQFIFDPLDVRIAVCDDLFGRDLRLTFLGQHRLLGCLAALGRFGRFARLAEPSCFASPAAGACPLFPTPSTPVNTPTTPPIAPPNTPPTGPAALLPAWAPCWPPLTSPCAPTAEGALRSITTTAPSATRNLNAAL